MSEDKVFQQDLNGENESSSVFVMQLLMKEKCSMPEKEYMTSVMEKHLGTVENFSYSRECAGFAVEKYNAEFKDKTVHTMLMITDCCDSKNENIDAFTRSQMWDCP